MVARPLREFFIGYIFSSGRFYTFYPLPICLLLQIANGRVDDGTIVTAGVACEVSKVVADVDAKVTQPVTVKDFNLRAEELIGLISIGFVD